MKKKVFVGVSGGVDSAVSCYLLQYQGYDVTGVFMKNWSGDDYGTEDNCPWKEDQEMASSVCQHLGIPFMTFNFEKEYRDNVISDFYYQYSIGNTPNPDVLCNKYIKFNSFLKKAIESGADYIATGHYSNSNKGHLFKAKDEKKDQTYFLHQLNKEQLLKSIFPLGNLVKNDVRGIAKKIDLPNASRKDSQGICFIGKVDIRDFLKKELAEKDGEIIDIDTGKIIGTHKGVWSFTIGQRKGSNIGGSTIPYFVAKKDVEKNIIYVAKGKENKSLYGSKFKIENLNEIHTIPRNKKLECQIRYHGEYISCVLRENNVLETNRDVWAPAVGQSIVIYDKEECLGGGPITEIIE